MDGAITLFAKYVVIPSVKNTTMSNETPSNDDPEFNKTQLTANAHATDIQDEVNQLQQLSPDDLMEIVNQNEATQYHS